MARSIGLRALSMSTVVVVAVSASCTVLAEGPLLESLSFYKYTDGTKDYVGMVRHDIGVDPRTMNPVDFRTCANRNLLVDGAKLIPASGDCKGKPPTGTFTNVVFGKVIDFGDTGVLIGYPAAAGGLETLTIKKQAWPVSDKLKAGDGYVFYPTSSQTKDQFVADFKALKHVVGTKPNDKGIGVLELYVK